MSASIGDLSREALVELLDNSNSFSEALRKIGYSVDKGGNFKTLKLKMAKEGLDYQEYKTKYLSDKKYIKANNLAITDTEAFSMGSRVKSGPLKKRIFKKGLLPNKCSECGLGGIWNGKKLVLQLDHINGISNDNRIENLRILCPNCHSQTDTYSGKRKRYPAIKSCSVCLEPIHHYSKTYRCVKCSSIERGLENRKPKPIKEELVASVGLLGYAKTGRKYGVSDNTIRNWLLFYGVDLKSVFRVKKEIICLCTVCGKQVSSKYKSRLCPSCSAKNRWSKRKKG